MKWSAKDIAALLGGRVEGNEEVQVDTAAKIQEGQPNAICFLANPKYENYLYETQAGIVLVSEDFKPRQAVRSTLIFVKDAYAAFSQLMEAYAAQIKPQKEGVEQPSFLAEGVQPGEGFYLGAFAYVGKGCTVGENVKIYPGAYVGENCTIGDDTVILAGAKVYPDTQIGKRCTLHAGAVVGSDGFGFAPQEDGSYRAIPQLGNVILEDDVSIGANTTVDCATMGSTVIEQGVKLDNLIQVGHNVKVGAHTVIAALTGIAGSAEIGKQCMIGGQVGIVGHIKIAERTTLMGQSGVSNDIVEPGQQLLGAPAVDSRENIKSLIAIKKLPQMRKQIMELEKRLKALEATQEKT